MAEREAPTVDQAADDISSMRVRGAAALARHAVAALGALARSDADEAAIKAAAEKLMASRPSAVSLRNGIEYALGGLAAGPGAVNARAERFVADSLRARERCAVWTSTLIEDIDHVVTHCNSQAAIASLTARHARRPFETVTVLETRPWRQGLITARQLAEAGLPVRFMVDAAMGVAVAEAEAVVTGADTIAYNGDVVNKIGTALLSLAAREVGTPFYVAAESFKVDVRAPTGADVVIEQRESAEVLDEPIEGVTVANLVFDVTPAERVTRIGMDTGHVAPADAGRSYAELWAAQEP